MKLDPKKRIPPDLKRCQAERVHEGHTFMCMGCNPNPVQCTNVPTCIAYEAKSSWKDGKKGSMSLCDRCRVVCEKQMPGKVTFGPIRLPMPFKPRCPTCNGLLRERKTVGGLRCRTGHVWLQGLADAPWG